MQSLEFVLWIVYMIALASIVWFVMESRRRSADRRSVAIVVEPPLVSWWPWSISRYNEWPYWSGWYVGGGGGGYSAPPVRPPHHGGNGSHHGGSHGEHDRPWGEAGRTANAGGFHSPKGPSGPASGPSGPSR